MIVRWLEKERAVGGARATHEVWWPSGFIQIVSR